MNGPTIHLADFSSGHKILRSPALQRRRRRWFPYSTDTERVGRFAVRTHGPRWETVLAPEAAGVL